METTYGQRRPTASIRRVDVVHGEPRASAGADREAALFRGYDAPRVRRVESCACGGKLVQFDDDTPHEVVAIHQSTAVHRAWRDRVGL